MSKDKGIGIVKNKLDILCAEFLWAIREDKVVDMYKKQYFVGATSKDDETAFEAGQSIMIYRLTRFDRGALFGEALRSFYLRNDSMKDHYNSKAKDFIYEVLYDSQFSIPIDELQTYFADNVDIVEVFSRLEKEFKNE